MKLNKLTVLGIPVLALFMGLSSCEKQPDRNPPDVYSKSDISGTGAQIAPNPSPSPGQAKLSVSYDRKAKLLNYTVSWSGLTDSVIAVRINGPAPAGYSALKPGFTVAAGDSSNFLTTPYIVIQETIGASNRPMAPSTGSFTGSLFIDDVRAKELDLLNQYYYVTLHTKTILPVPGASRFFFRWFGEVRAQVILQ